LDGDLRFNHCNSSECTATPVTPNFTRLKKQLSFCCSVIYSRHSQARNSQRPVATLLSFPSTSLPLSLKPLCDSLQLSPWQALAWLYISSPFSRNVSPYPPRFGFEVPHPCISLFSRLAFLHHLVELLLLLAIVFQYMLPATTVGILKL